MSNCNDSINISSVNSWSWNAAAAPLRFRLWPQGGQFSGLGLIGGVVIAGCQNEPKHQRSEKICWICFQVCCQ